MRRRRKNRRIIRNRIIAILIAFLAVLLLCSFIAAKNSRSDIGLWETYTVQPGDTLWELTREIYGNDCDIREIIDIIAKENEIRAGKIMAGDVIILPMVDYAKVKE